MEKGTLGSPFFRSRLGCRKNLGRLDDLFAANAASADPNPLRSAVNQHANGLKIGHPAPLPPVVGVADMVAGRWAFGADGADTCHSYTSLLVVLGVDLAAKFNPQLGMTQGILCRGR